MANRSHFNSAHRAINRQRKLGRLHSSHREVEEPARTLHLLAVADCLQLLAGIPSGSVQLIICDPPYNLDMADWDRFEDYQEWAARWIEESSRVLKDSGSLVIFGGLQYQSGSGGDLLELMHHVRHHTRLRLVNLIVWHYRNGMSAHRFFANRHEEIAWFTKSSRYTFNLDAVRLPYDERTKREYLRDKRLNPETVKKGKNPTNVWELPRLNGNSKERLGHPTQKPLELIRRIVRSMSNPGDTVLDFFAGTASTMRVCQEEARHSICGDTDSKLHEYGRRQIERPEATFHEFETSFCDAVTEQEIREFSTALRKANQ